MPLVLLLYWRHAVTDLLKEDKKSWPNAPVNEREREGEGNTEYGLLQWMYCRMEQNVPSRTKLVYHVACKISSQIIDGPGP